MPVLTLVIGLSASGKSTLLQGYIRAGIPVFDDFMKGSPEGFPNCEHLGQMRRHIAAGRDLVLADICLVRPAFRKEVLHQLAAADYRVNHICFKNDPRQCIKNSRTRADRQRADHESEKKSIPKFSSEYVIPHGAEVIDVVDARHYQAGSRLTSKDF